MVITPMTVMGMDIHMGLTLTNPADCYALATLVAQQGDLSKPPPQRCWTSSVAIDFVFSNAPNLQVQTD